MSDGDFSHHRLSGKRAVVVGGGQQPGQTIGNGRAAALAYAREGARVLVVDRDLAAAEETAEQIRAASGEASAHQTDVTDPVAVDGLVRAALAEFGAVDILHNNVGVVVASATENTDLEEWERGIALNLTGTWNVCRAFLPSMRQQQRGVLINISSLASVIATATSYGVAKAGLNALTRGLALEYAPHGIRVNAIIPGMIDTPIGVDRILAGSEKTREEIVASRAAVVPMGYQGTAWDIAQAAVFLASDEASYITGVVLPVDGGASLGRLG